MTALLVGRPPMSGTGSANRFSSVINMVSGRPSGGKLSLPIVSVTLIDRRLDGAGAIF
jgi:hypothetical protein